LFYKRPLYSPTEQKVDTSSTIHSVLPWRNGSLLFNQLTGSTGPFTSWGRVHSVQTQHGGNRFKRKRVEQITLLVLTF